jgi:hypothetical protein
VISERIPPRCYVAADHCDGGRWRRARMPSARAVSWFEPPLQAEISYSEMMQGRESRCSGRSCYQAERDGHRLPPLPPCPCSRPIVRARLLEPAVA